MRLQSETLVGDLRKRDKGPELLSVILILQEKTPTKTGVGTKENRIEWGKGDVDDVIRTPA